MNIASMQSILRRNSVLLGCTLSFLFWGVLVSTFHMGYAISDDVYYITKLLGLDGFPALDFDIFLSRSLTYILTQLYAHWPSIPWYGLTLSLAYILSGGLYIGLWLRRSHGWSSVLSVVVLCWYVGCLFWWSFTSATTFLLSAVFLSFLELLVHPKDTPQSKWYPYFIALCCIVGLGLRTSICVGVGLFTLPILFFLSKVSLRQWLPYIAVLSLAYGFSFFVPPSKVSPQNTKQFIQYNTTRAQFHDTSLGEYYPGSTPNALRTAGWTSLDYTFYKLWNLHDSRKFTLKSIQAFVEKNRPPFWNVLFKGFEKTILFNKMFILQFLCAFILLLGVFRASFKASSKVRKHAFITGVVLSLVGIIALMSFRFLERVYLPIFAHCITLFIVLHIHPKENEETSEQTNVHLIHTMLFICILCTIAYTTWIQLDKYTQKYKRIQQDRIELKQSRELLNKKGLLKAYWFQMSPIDGWYSDTTSPLYDRLPFKPRGILPSGTAVQSPRYNAILKSLGLQDGHALLRWTLDNPSVYFVLQAYNHQHVRIFWSTWQKYYQKNITPKQKILFVKKHDLRTHPNRKGLVFFQVMTEKALHIWMKKRQQKKKGPSGKK